MNKTRVLVYSDAGQPTGFERMTRSLFSHLDPNIYDITVCGIGYCGQQDLEPYPFKVIPASLNLQNDPLGLHYFKKMLKQYNPDILILIQDIWNVMRYIMIKPKELRTIVYTLPDSPNIKWIYGLCLGGVSEVIVPSLFGARELAASVQQALGVYAQHSPNLTDAHAEFELTHDSISLYGRLDRLARFQNIAAYNQIPLARPIPPNDIPSKAEARLAFKLPTDKFIILNVSTNSWRKRLDLTLFAFKKLNNPNAHLVIHCQGHQDGGIDLKQLILALNLTDRVTLIHELFGILNERSLYALYKAADLQINTSGGEGWGLTSFEGTEVGTPQLVPNWGASQDAWLDHQLIDTSGSRILDNQVNTFQGQIDINDLCDKMNDRINGAPDILILPRYIMPASDCAKYLDLAIERAFNEPEIPMKLKWAEILALREINIESQMLDIF